MKQGDFLQTPYGEGIVLFYRENDGIYVIDLPFGTLYANSDSVSPSSSHKNKTTMELNVAYESLDKMRKLNLEVECQQRGYIVAEVDHTQCTTCLLEELPSRVSGNCCTRRFPRIQKLVQDPRLQKLIQEGRKNIQQIHAQPCLLCGSPVCRTHSSAEFRKEGIPVCLGCERLFTLEFVVDCMTAPSSKERRQHLDHMMDVYDRAVLLLKYSSQFIDPVAEQLQDVTKRQNHVGLGSSGAGIVSGVLGVAAAATILTPAGPPLLIASLLFGGSATAVQTGTEVKNYYSDANRLANRILALHGMALSILKTTSALRDALLRDYLRTDAMDKENSLKTIEEQYTLNRGKVMAGLTVGRYGAAGMEIGSLVTASEVGVVAGRASGAGRLVGRTGTGLMRTVRLARFAGGALSAATLLLETKSMTHTILQIQAGNPCEKAEMLLKIKADLEDLPCTSMLDGECQAYLEGMAQRERRMTQEEVVKLLMDASQFQDYQNDDDEGQLILEPQDDNVTTATEEEEEVSVAPSVDASTTTTSTTTKTSLLERIEMYKRNDDLSGSLIERINRYKKREGGNDALPTTNDEQVPISTLV